MNKSKALSVLIFLLYLPFTSYAQTSPNLDELHGYYEQMIIDWDVPGMSIAVVKDGETVFKGNYGVLETGKKTPPDENTLYAIASNSKAFTTAIIGMLVDEGRLNWDDKVKKYLPYFELYDPWVSNEVTIKDLLCHRVGLGTFSGDIIWYKSDLTSKKIIRSIRHLPPAFDFRAGYGYSNLMYITAGEVIKKATGKSWSENLQKRILDPLGMDRTITTPDKRNEKGNFATPHARSGEENTPIAWEDWQQVGATGGIISSTEDMAKWMVFNLNNGIWNGDTLFSAKTRNMVWTPHNNFIIDHTNPNDVNMHFLGYGLGWVLNDFHGNLVARHTGGYDGMISAITLVPDQQLGVVVLTNGMKSPIRAATYHAIYEFLGMEARDWSSELLQRYNDNQEKDTRVAERKKKRMMNTSPSLPLEKYTGIYKSDIYGNIIISLIEGMLQMKFEHTPDLSANLTHWHYDVWKIEWDQKHAWFDFGTVQFTLDNNLNVKGMNLDVPNDDIFFHELKPYKIK